VTSDAKSVELFDRNDKATVIGLLVAEDFSRCSTFDEEMKMKKKILLLSTAGIAAGLVYALESSRRKRAAADAELPGVPKSSANLPTSTAASANPNDSDGTSERGASMARQGEEEHQIDDLGTSQAEASHILKEIRDAAFDASDEKLALALGRPADEIEHWTSGNGLIDGDVIMKARTLALQRDLDI
jgi:hypothetical protein